MNSNTLQQPSVAPSFSIGSESLASQVRKIAEPSLKKWFGIEIENHPVIADRIHETGEVPTLSVYVQELDGLRSHMLLFDGFGLQGSMYIAVRSEELTNCPFLVATNALGLRTDDSEAFLVIQPAECDRIWH